MKIYEDYMNKILVCHSILAGIPNCLKYDCYNKYDKAIMNNLKQIAVHCSEKRIDMREYLEKSNLLALCQYEFMYESTMKYAKSNLLKQFMQMAINEIRQLRKEIGMPRFESKDEIVIVEVDPVDKKYRAIPIDKFEDYDGEYNRILPIDKNHINLRSRCFLNSVGDSRKAVMHVKNNISTKEVKKDESN